MLVWCCSTQKVTRRSSSVTDPGGCCPGCPLSVSAMVRTVCTCSADSSRSRRPASAASCSSGARSLCASQCNISARLADCCQAGMLVYLHCRHSTVNEGIGLGESRLSHSRNYRKVQTHMGAAKFVRLSSTVARRFCTDCAVRVRIAR